MKNLEELSGTLVSMHSRRARMYSIKSIPVNKGKMLNGRFVPDAFKYQRALRWDFEFRTNLLEKMQKEDNNINGNCLRAITGEFINFSDGKKQ
jgi:hypothetical protein